MLQSVYNRVVDIFDLIKRGYPTTLFAWYGDSLFAGTILSEMGWRITRETSIADSSTLVALFDDISDTLPQTQHTDRLIHRSVNRWNLLVWRNDSGGGLQALDDLALQMPVYEFTLTDLSTRITSVVGLGTHRRSLSSEIYAGKISEPESHTLALLNSVGLRASKTVTLYPDPKSTLLNAGAPTNLFDFASETSGKTMLLYIDDLEI